MATLQKIMKANEVQYIDPNEPVVPEPNSYGYPNMQKGGETKEEDSYGLTDFTKDAYEAWFNPKNYGVKEYSEKNFDKAYTKARSEGEKEFLYENRRYNTNYDGTPSEQLKETGITDDQLQGYNFIREQLSKNLAPKGYDNKLERVAEAVFTNKTPQDKVEFDKVAKNESGTANWEVEWNRKRIDAHNLYTGKPQKYNTFSISKNKPTNSTDSNNNETYYSITSPQLKHHLSKIINNNEEIRNKTYEDDTGVMGNYIVNTGEDEDGKFVSYYDKWDISPVDYGKPMEIYDKVYYEENKDFIPEEELRNMEEELGNNIDEIFSKHKDKEGNLPKKYSEEVSRLWEKKKKLGKKETNKYIFIQ